VTQSKLATDFTAKRKENKKWRNNTTNSLNAKHLWSAETHSNRQRVSRHRDGDRVRERTRPWWFKDDRVTVPPLHPFSSSLTPSFHTKTCRIQSTHSRGQHIKRKPVQTASSSISKQTFKHSVTRSLVNW